MHRIIYAQFGYSLKNARSLALAPTSGDALMRASLDLRKTYA